jgi:histone deacetylase 6
MTIISAGYDAAIRDPLGGIDLYPEGFAYMTLGLKELCPRIVAVLEGGYNLVSIADASEATFRSLMG